MHDNPRRPREGGDPVAFAEGARERACAFAGTT